MIKDLIEKLEQDPLFVDALNRAQTEEEKKQVRDQALQVLQFFAKIGDALKQEQIDS